MIAYLTGQLFFKNLKHIILIVRDVGYKIMMPFSDLSVLTIGEKSISIHVHTQLRENGIELYGFLLEQNLQIFEQLINISGIGPKMALSILSTIESGEFAKAIHDQDSDKLVKIPGIGHKMAQRLVLELKDKVDMFLRKDCTIIDANSVLVDLQSAMINLGYNLKQVDKAIGFTRNHLKTQEGKKEDSFLELLKKALREI